MSLCPMSTSLSPCPWPCVHIPVPVSISQSQPPVLVSIPVPMSISTCLSRCLQASHPYPWHIPVSPGLLSIPIPTSPSHSPTTEPPSHYTPQPRVPARAPGPACPRTCARPPRRLLKGSGGKRGGAGPQPIRTRAPRLASPARQSARRPHGNPFPAPELLRPGTAPPAAGTRFLPGKDPPRGPPLPTRRHGKPSQGPSRLQPSPGAGGGGGTTRGAEEEAALQQRHGGSVRTALNAAPALLGSAPRMRFPARFAYERPLAAGRAPGVSPRRGQGAGVGRGSTGVYWAVLGCAGLCRALCGSFSIVLNHAGLYKVVLYHTGPCWAVQSCTASCSAVRDCTVLGHTGLYWAILGCTGTCRAVWGCTELHCSILRCTGLYLCYTGHMGLCCSIWGYTGL